MHADSVGLEWALRCFSSCISDKLFGDAEVACLKTILVLVIFKNSESLSHQVLLGPEGKS